MRVRIAHVDLCDLRSSTAPGILDRERNLNLAGPMADREFAISKSCVGEAESKWEQRLDCGTVEMTVAEEHAFGVRNAVSSRLEVIAVVSCAFLNASFERYGQFP